MLLCVILLHMGVAVRARSQQTPDYFHHQVWSTEDGLPQASVHAILQGHEGYLWVATEGGAARFDGQSFLVLNHATTAAFTSDDVSCLAESPVGDLWFGTSDGLVRKHGEEYKRFSDQQGLPSNKIVALAANASGLLVLTANGLAAWKNGHFAPVATKETLAGLVATPSGTLAVTDRGAIYRWESGQLVAVAPNAPDQSGVLGLAGQDGRTVWTFGATFVQFPGSLHSTIWHTGKELIGSRVQALNVDRNEQAWIGTNRGLMSLNAMHPSQPLTVPELQGESVLCIYEDREGDIWVGTEASGLHVLQPRRFATVPGTNSENITAIVRAGLGAMYFGTRDSGLYQSTNTVVPVAPNKLTSPLVLSLAAGRDDDVWVGTPDGLNQVSGGAVRHWTISEGLPDNFVRSVAVAADGTAWAGTRYGLVHLSDNSVRTFSVADGLSANSIGPLFGTGAAGDATLWIGTSAGLCRETKLIFHCLPSPYDHEQSVTALGAGRDGTIWAASHGQGLALVLSDQLLPVRSSAIPAEIAGILADSGGSLWLRARQGLYRASARGLRECATHASACNAFRVDSYGRADGLPSDEAADEGIAPVAQGPNGELWFATRRGIAVTDPQHFQTASVSPGVVMTRVQVDGVDVGLGAPAELAPNHRQYSFEYTGLSFNNASRTRYRYMLEGFDHSWVDAGSRRTAYYTNLPPRQYVFRVVSANSDGLWSTDEATFRFLVQKPWYRRLWVYVLACCFAALMVFGFDRLRVRTERRRFALVLQERTRVAREVHDTLAQDLVSVSLQVDIATQHARAGRLQETTDQLARTKSLVRQALDSARQSIWNLRANLSDESLPTRLTARVNASRDKDVSPRLRIGGEYRSADATVENEVMRIASEAISNVERHAGASEMTVELSYSADYLRLEVRDNGRGFDYAAARGLAGHYGLQGLEERAAVLGGELSVNSMAGQGTTVILTAPLPAEKV